MIALGSRSVVVVKPCRRRCGPGSSAPPGPPMEVVAVAGQNLPTAQADLAAGRPGGGPWADELTGLPNRALLARWLEARTGPRARPGQRIGLCSVDLDGFRQINALLGFGAGDRFLAAVA